MTTTERAYRDRKNARQRERYYERTAAGACALCRQPVGGGSSAYCEPHLIQMRKRVKRMLMARLSGSHQCPPAGSKT